MSENCLHEEEMFFEGAEEFIKINELATATADDESLRYLDEVTGEITSGANESVCVVEYIEEDDGGDEAAKDELMSKHTLLLRQDEHDNEFYSCQQCNVDYVNMEEFTQAHKRNRMESNADEVVLESQWEALDEVPEESAVESAETAEELGVESAETAGGQIVPMETILPDDDKKDEFNEQDKFYCCECQTVFSDLESAEEHDCPMLNANNDDEADEGGDADKNYEPNEGDDDEEDDDVEEKPGKKKNNAKSGKRFNCELCKRSFNSVNALSSHSRMHKLKVEAPSVASCHICNTHFSSDKNLKFHMRIHNKRPAKSIEDALPAGAKMQYNELNQFYCEICNKSFDQNLLVVHKNMHQNLEEFTCGTCNRQFDNRSSYDMHMKLHVEKQRRLREDRPVSKSKHLRVDGKMCFPCQYCGHEFARPYEKVKHERVHTGEKPYECEVCGKTFRVAYSLTLHLRTHTNIRPYVCATCNKRFKSQPVYTHHLKTHQNERAYKCDQCPKSFRTAVQLCGHRNSHKKPFTCPECNRPFAALYAVKVHMLTHRKSSGRTSGGKSSDAMKHRCKHCGAIYARLFALRLHLKEQHNIDMLDSKQLGVMPNVSDDDDDDEIAGEGEILPSVMDDAPTTSKAQRQGGKKAASPMVGDGILSDDEQLILDAFQTEEIVNDDDEWLPA